ncbi:hypothetical protein AAG570_007167 [Ranatra chinensis]|uniref:Kelch-like protein diablo n=1 Tax=Ranatra chinensis TaxID=642074 RepID=A0ABD0XV31_9HEMI
MEDEMSEAVPKPGLSFTDDRHPSLVLHSLNMMRKNRTFCDVVLHVGGSELHAHRAVLASVSPHLLEMFSTDDDKGIRETIISYKLNGAFERSALDKLIDYAYTSKLELSPMEVRSVFVAATQLKMERVSRECASHLVQNLSVETCIETRSLPGIVRDRAVLAKVDNYIAAKFEEVRQSPGLLALPCVKIEVLSRSLKEMTLVGCESLCRLALDWLKRTFADSPSESATEKTHLLYLAMDNSLQDCTELPAGDASDTEIVQDYKRMSKSTQQANKKKSGRKGQPAAKPRVIIYNRDILDSTEQEREGDWKLVASTKVRDHTFLGLATMQGRLGTLSVLLRLNAPVGQGDDDCPLLYCGLANMEYFKCGAGCANLNDNLLVCGGYDRAECLRSVELYSPEANAWASLAPMLEARGRFNITVVKGLVYAVGGCNGTTELATVERYSSLNRKWERIASLPMARSNTGVTSLKGKIYCIGGWNGQVGIRQCDVFDPESSKWTSIAPLQTGRYQAGVCSMDGKVWVVGGCDGWNCLNSVEVYTPADEPSQAQESWAYSKRMITARRGCGVALFKGGSDGTQSLATTEIYDPVEKVWSPGPSMTTARSNVGVAVIGSRLYAVGGFSGERF